MTYRVKKRIDEVDHVENDFGDAEAHVLFTFHFRMVIEFFRTRFSRVVSIMGLF